MTIAVLIRDLISDWYRRDRVRVSPATGRLLSLQTGDRFIFQNDEFVVRSRHLDVSDSCRELIYQLEGSCGASQLQVLQGPDLVAKAELDLDGKIVTVFEEEVAVVSARASSSS